MICIAAPDINLGNMIVEVFKTNVPDRTIATSLLNLIHERHPFYKANFDLEDCDRILRVASDYEHIDVQALISLLQSGGYSAEVLPENDVSEPLIQQH